MYADLKLSILSKHVSFQCFSEQTGRFSHNRRNKRRWNEVQTSRPAESSYHSFPSGRRTWTETQQHLCVYATSAPPFQNKTGLLFCKTWTWTHKEKKRRKRRSRSCAFSAIKDNYSRVCVESCDCTDSFMYIQEPHRKIHTAFSAK